MKFTYHWALFALALSACVEPVEDHSYVVHGYRPVYGTAAATEIKWLSPRSINAPGKIYVYGDYLLINEQKKGIHVFDNSDPSHPVALGFVEILGNTDMAVRNGEMFADHIGNLVRLRLNNFASVTKVDEVPLQNWHLGVPAPAGSSFECVDPSKGIVVSWEAVELQNPKCHARY